MKWYFIVSLNCIFLVTNDVELLFTCLLAILISSFVKCLFKSFSHFFVELSFYCLFLGNLYIVWMGVFCQIYVLWILYPSLWFTYSCKNTFSTSLKQTHVQPLCPQLGGEEACGKYQPRKSYSTKCFHARCLVILRLGVSSCGPQSLQKIWAPRQCHVLSWSCQGQDLN